MNESTVNGHQDHSNDFEEIRIPVPWGQISGKWWGKRNVQPVIGIHGWQDNCGTFDNLAPLLVKQGISFYCIDLPGHGFSSPIPTGLEYYVWWDGVHFLRRIVKYFDWKNITIIGHSLGGGISFLYSSIYPDDVAKYVSIDIVSPTVRNISKMMAAVGPSVDKLFEYEKMAVNQMPCYDYEEMVDILEQAHNGSINRNSCIIMLRRGMKPAGHKPGCYLFTRDPRLKIAALGFFTIDLVLEFAARIKCEVLNIKAAKGLDVPNPEYYDITLDAIEKNAKKLERHQVVGTHHVHLNDAQIVAPIITNFFIKLIV